MRAVCDRRGAALPPGRQGGLAVGDDGDVVLVRLDDPRVLQGEELPSRDRLSPYLGRTLTARVLATILRGQTIYRDGRLVGEPHGRLVTPFPML